MKSVVFSVNGTINFETALAFREKGDRWIDKQEDIIVDFQAVNHCNSAGLALMTAWMRHAKRLGKPIRFINVPSTLQVIANVCGMVEILGMKKSHG